MKDFFGTLGTPVATLEDEIKRLKDKVPADITKAWPRRLPNRFQGRMPAKRKLCGKSAMLSLAYATSIRWSRSIKKSTPPRVQKLRCLDRRRRPAAACLLDILAPCEIFCPGAFGRAAFPCSIKSRDLDNPKLDQLQNLLRKRFEVAIADKFDGDVHLSKDWDLQKRLSTEKRATIGFLLLAVANVQQPDLKQPDRFIPLYPEGSGQGAPNLLRAQTVLGLYEFAASAKNLPVAWNILEDRIIQAIYVDREGFEDPSSRTSCKFKEFANKPTRNQAFVDKHAAGNQGPQGHYPGDQKSAKAFGRIAGAKPGRQENLRRSRRGPQGRDGNAEGRPMRRFDRNRNCRRWTEACRKQLFEAQKVLANAQEQNIRLEQAIKAEEQRAKGPKGATP